VFRSTCAAHSRSVSFCGMTRVWVPQRPVLVPRLPQPHQRLRAHAGTSDPMPSIVFIGFQVVFSRADGEPNGQVRCSGELLCAPLPVAGKRGLLVCVCSCARAFRHAFRRMLTDLDRRRAAAAQCLLLGALPGICTRAVSGAALLACCLSVGACVRLE
jgi:hypothetical protein